MISYAFNRCSFVKFNDDKSEEILLNFSLQPLAKVDVVAEDGTTICANQLLVSVVADGAPPREKWLSVTSGNVALKPLLDEFPFIYQHCGPSLRKTEREVFNCLARQFNEIPNKSRCFVQRCGHHYYAKTHFYVLSRQLILWPGGKQPETISLITDGIPERLVAPSTPPLSCSELMHMYWAYLDEGRSVLVAGLASIYGLFLSMFRSADIPLHNAVFYMEGESASGKTTVATAMTQLYCESSANSIRIDAKPKEISQRLEGLADMPFLFDDLCISDSVSAMERGTDHVDTILRNSVQAAVAYNSSGECCWPIAPIITAERRPASKSLATRTLRVEHTKPAALKNHETVVPAFYHAMLQYGIDHYDELVGRLRLKYDELCQTHPFPGGTRSQSALYDLALAGWLLLEYLRTSLSIEPDTLFQSILMQLDAVAVYNVKTISQDSADVLCHLLADKEFRISKSRPDSYEQYDGYYNKKTGCYHILPSAVHLRISPLL